MTKNINLKDFTCKLVKARIKRNKILTLDCVAQTFPVFFFYIMTALMFESITSCISVFFFGTAVVMNLWLHKLSKFLTTNLHAYLRWIYGITNSSFIYIYIYMSKSYMGMSDAKRFLFLQGRHCNRCFIINTTVHACSWVKFKVKTRFR